MRVYMFFNNLNKTENESNNTSSSDGNDVEGSGGSSRCSCEKTIYVRRMFNYLFSVFFFASPSSSYCSVFVILSCLVLKMRLLNCFIIHKS